MSKKKHFYTVICLVAGVILLTTAAAANFGNANGYPLYKSALKKILYEDNFTASLKLELVYDGETVQYGQTDLKLDSDGEVSKYSAESWGSAMPGTPEDAALGHESWVVKNKDADSETGAKYLTITHNGYYWYINPTFGEPWTDPAKDELTRKAMRFAELIADTFVGDLKNNFVQTSDEDGRISYQIILSGNQLPEYVSAGLSMMFSMAKDRNNTYVFYHPDFDSGKEESFEVSQKAWEMLSKNGNKGVVFVSADGTLHYFDNLGEYFESDMYAPSADRIDEILYTLNTDPTPEVVKLFFTIDEEGRLLSNVIEGIVSSYDHNGERHTLGLRITLNIGNYDTTVVDYPVIPEGDTVYDYSKPSFNGEYIIPNRDTADTDNE